MAGNMEPIETRHELRFRKYDWPDFVVIARQEWTSSIDFKVYEVIGTAGVGDGAPLLFHSEGWVSSPADSTTDVAKAEVYIDGGIKWDGCSNWEFGDVGHFCGRRDAVNLGAIMDALYDIAQAALKPQDLDMFNRG